MAIQVSFVGFAVRDAESKTAKSGNEYISLSLGVSKGKDEVEWVNATALGGLTKIAGAIKKGSRIFATGQLNARAYTSKDGEAKCSLDVLLHSIDFVSTGAKKESGENGASADSQGAPVVDDADIPF